MKLSMWNIYEALNFTGKNPIIPDGSATIRYARIYDEDDLRKNTVYVGPGKDFYYHTNAKQDGDVIIIHSNDIIVVQGAYVNEVFNEVATIIDRFNYWEHKLQDAAEENGGAQAMLEITQKFLPGAYYAYSLSGKELGLSCQADTNTGKVWNEIAETKDLSRERLQVMSRYIDFTGFKDGVKPTTRLSKDDKFSYTYMSLQNDDKNYGFIIYASDSKDIPKGTDIILEKLGEYIIKYFLLHADKMTLVAKGPEMLAKLLEDRDVPRETILYFRSIGWKRIGQYQIFAISCGDEHYNNRITDFIQETRAFFLNPIFCFVDKVLIMIVNIEMERDYDRQLEFYRKTIKDDFTCGISVRFSYLSIACDYCQQAIFEQKYAEKHGDNISDAKGHELYYYRSVMSKSPLNYCYVNRQLLLLVNHDIAEGTEYYPTMRAYLLSAYHMGDAAKIANVHRNTLQYRLEQIRKIIDLSEFDKAAQSMDEDALQNYQLSIFLIDEALERRRQRLNIR